MRYAPNRKDETRARLLNEASSMLRKEGAAGVNIAAIMSRLGLTHGGFYAHFKSKDDLIKNALELGFEQGRNRLKNATEARDPSEGLIHYLDDYLSLKHVRRPDEGCPLPALTAEMTRSLTGERERMQRGASNLRSALSSALEKMGVEPTRAASLATSALSEMVGAIMLARACSNDEDATAILDASKRSIRARFGLLIEAQ